MSNVLSFFVIWDTLKFKENLEDAHKNYYEIYDKQRLLIEAELKIIKNNKVKLQSFLKVNEDEEKSEPELIIERNKIDHFIEEIEDYGEALTPKISEKFLDAKRDFETAQEIFTIQEDKIKNAAKAEFDKIIVEKFQTWRMDEIERLKQRINRKGKILQKQIKIAQKGTDESLSRSTSRKTSKDTHRTKGSEGMRRRPTIYEQIFKDEQKRIEKQETRSTTTDDG
uniref:Uncharacterized protein n=1 Tax=Panagrolaimus sp. ES5 TaxID=591445 RepID=A0AC34FBL0_9BILA